MLARAGAAASRDSGGNRQPAFQRQALLLRRAPARGGSRTLPARGAACRRARGDRCHARAARRRVIRGAGTSVEAPARRLRGRRGRSAAAPRAQDRAAITAGRSTRASRPAASRRQCNAVRRRRLPGGAPLAGRQAERQQHQHHRQHRAEQPHRRRLPTGPSTSRPAASARPPRSARWRRRGPADVGQATALGARAGDAGEHRGEHRQRGQQRGQSQRPGRQRRGASRCARPRPAWRAPAAHRPGRSPAAADRPPRAPGRPGQIVRPLRPSRCSATGRAGRRWPARPAARCRASPSARPPISPSRRPISERIAGEAKPRPPAATADVAAGRPAGRPAGRAAGRAEARVAVGMRIGDPRTRTRSSRGERSYTPEPAGGRSLVQGRARGLGGLWLWRHVAADEPVQPVSTADICIVGAGPVGGTLACRLAQARASARS